MRPGTDRHNGRGGSTYPGQKQWAQVASVVLAGLQHLQQQRAAAATRSLLANLFVAVTLAALPTSASASGRVSAGVSSHLGKQRSGTWMEATWKGSRNALTVCLRIGIACSLAPHSNCLSVPLCDVSNCECERASKCHSYGRHSVRLLHSVSLPPPPLLSFLFYLLPTNKIILILDFFISFCCC